MQIALRILEGDANYLFMDDKPLFSDINAVQMRVEKRRDHLNPSFLENFMQITSELIVLLVLIDM